jgi:hypothetical protein
MEGLFFLAVLAIAKYLDRKFIGLKLAFLAYIFEDGLDFFIGKFLDFAAGKANQMAMGSSGDFRLIVAVVLSKVHLAHQSALHKKVQRSVDSG